MALIWSRKLSFHDSCLFGLEKKVTSETIAVFVCTHFDKIYHWAKKYCANNQLHIPGKTFSFFLWLKRVKTRRSLASWNSCVSKGRLIPRVGSLINSFPSRTGLWHLPDNLAWSNRWFQQTVDDGKLSKNWERMGYFLELLASSAWINTWRKKDDRQTKY